MGEEIARITARHKPYNSAHEGHSVIREELDEVWDEVRRDDVQAAAVEAIQVAATAIRFVADLGVFQTREGESGETLLVLAPTASEAAYAEAEKLFAGLYAGNAS